MFITALAHRVFLKEREEEVLVVVSMAGVFPMDDEGLGDLAHNGHEIHSDDDCIEVGFFQI